MVGATSAPVASVAAAGRPSPEGHALDPFVQAGKALSHCCPFDAEETAPRVPTLPSNFAAVLTWSIDGRKKHKKSYSGEPLLPPPPPKKPSSVPTKKFWDEMEAYFRPITQADIDELASRLQFDSTQLDSALLIPVVGRTIKNEQKVDNLVDVTVEVSSALAPDHKSVVLEEPGKELENVEVNNEVKPINLDEVKTSGGDTSNEEEEKTLDSSIHWLLGSKERGILTSERPNKKRKLLGGDAGLVRLLILPLPQMEGSICDFCCLGESTSKSNRMLQCNACKTLVHQRCYGVHQVPETVWLCCWCKHLETIDNTSTKEGLERPCLLCPVVSGALKPILKYSSRNTSGGTLEFAHLFCGLWTPEVFVVDTEIMDLAINIGGMLEARKKLVCNVCKVKYGICVRCSHGTCRTSFHPRCARESGHQMEIWGKLGCDNVELRAFCSKHSCSIDSNSVGDSNRFISDDVDSSTISKPLVLDEAFPDKKIPKLRFTRRNRDKTMEQDDNASLDSDKIVRIETTLVQNPVDSKLSHLGGQANSKLEMDTDLFTVRGDGIDITLILRKLIDRGKVNADDVASELGISSDSLQAALLGKTTSFSPGLRAKIIKWLQTSVHVPAQLSGRAGPLICLDNKFTNINGSNSVKEIQSDDECEETVDIEIADAAHIRSLPPCRRTKSDIKILKDTKQQFSSDINVSPQKGSGNCNKHQDSSFLNIEDAKSKKSSAANEGIIVKEQELLEKAPDATMNVEDLGCQLHPEVEGNPTNSDLSDLFKRSHVKNISEGVASFEFDAVQTVKDRGCSNHCTHNADMASSIPDNEFSEVDSLSYVHPFIKKKLMHMHNNMLFEQNTANQENANLEAAQMDQLAKAKNSGILELSPDDEVEGEILFLQASMLEKAVGIKHRCENLISKIVSIIPHELDVLSKRKWDLVLVNQFLREMREAKKRGRKERRHKEAQAVLAAATALAATSTRNPLRKDINDESVSPAQEISLKLNPPAGRHREHSSSKPRAKESCRSSLSKVSLDKHSAVFKLPDFGKDNALSCEICFRAETLIKRIFVCSNCKVAVHLDCYCRLRIPIGPWMCELCEEMSLHSSSPKSQTNDRDISTAVTQCALCGNSGSAIRKTTDGQWVHAFCAEWLLESRFSRGQEDPVEVMDLISNEKIVCTICHRGDGVCRKCSYGNCQLAFHPYCARGAGFYMNTKATAGIMQHKAYCSKHSLEQREADNQHYGAEELKNIKQIRVELEKLRLLCERIIKREKLKRDLVLCSHDILASKRDYVAFSVLVRSSFCPPGVSSESATTSINKSFSGTLQRSDDITIDSTVSGKRAIRLSHTRDPDRNTEDSSTSQLSSKRKLADGESFAGKQLPQRSLSITFRNSIDGEKKSKARKPAETFQKELVMTSDQASMQNQRLPKGFAYVPIDRLSKEKPHNHDEELHEALGPGG